MTPAGPEAAATLAAIHAEAFDRLWSAAALADLLASPGVAALAQGEDGFILVRRVLDEAEVLTLAVRPAARRRGVGRALVEAAAGGLAQAGAGELWLEVACDNAAALALYTAAGFAEAGRRRGYYPREGGPGVDAVVLRRRLNREPD